MKAISRIVVLAALSAAITGAFAQSATTTPGATAPTATTLPADFAQKHPRIHEVNVRLRNERARIEGDLKSGKITQVQADRLLAKARKLHRQEVKEAVANGDHLTKEEQKNLNKEENALSDKISVDADKTQLNKDEKAEHAAVESEHKSNHK